MVSAEIIRLAATKGNRIYFIAHRKELIDQTSAKLDDLGVDHGVIMASHPRCRTSLPVQVVSIQTAIRRNMPWKPDIVFIDECHRARGNSYREILDACGNPVLIGITATPIRTDNKGLGGGLFQVMVQGPAIGDLIQRGFLVEPEVYSWPVDLRGVKTTAGDYNQPQLEAKMMESKLVGDVMEQWKKRCSDRTTVLFASGVGHSKLLADEFNAIGVKSAHIDGTTPKMDRESILAKLAAGDIQVVSNFGVLCEGWDCLDSQTEILTIAGWKKQGEVSVGEPMYSWNTATGNMEICPVLECGERPLRDGERMIEIKNQRVNIRVTEGHSFFIKYRDPARKGALSDSVIKQTAIELADRRSPYAFPIGLEYGGFPGVDLTDDELRLVAWFMTDGGFSGYAVAISQSKLYHNDIRDLLVRLKIPFKERVRDRHDSNYANALPLHEFNIPKGTRRGKIVSLGWSKYESYLNKNVAPSLHGMNRNQFKVFWEELLKGDGEKGSSNHSGWLWCDRQEQADAYTAMAVTRGFSASYSTRVTKTGKVMFRVGVRDRNWLCIDSPASKLSANVVVSSPVERETVWCVSNVNGTLVSRRNGKIAIIGNCPRVSALSIARPTKSMGLYMQMAGRALRPYPGKENCIILDHGGCAIRHGLPQEEKDWKLTEDRIKTSSDDAPDTKDVDDRISVCPDCGRVYPPGSVDTCECGYDFARSKRAKAAAIEADLVRIEAKNKAIQQNKRTIYFNFLWRQITGKKFDGTPYSDKYAAAKYMGQFNEWPPRRWLREFQEENGSIDELKEFY